jgi:hypothetical protein
MANALSPQDVVVALKLCAVDSKNWTYARLGEELSLSASQVFRSVQRAEAVRLLEPGFHALPSALDSKSPDSKSPDSKSKDRPLVLASPNRANLKEFLIHGVRYAFPVHRGGLVRGIPTAHAAPPLKQQIAESFDPPPVWPDGSGSARGLEFSPLYRNVPAAARRDPRLYELLALVDAIRDGRAREREIAIRELTARIDER